MNRALFVVTVSGLLWAIIYVVVAAVWFGSGPL